VQFIEPPPPNERDGEWEQATHALFSAIVEKGVLTRFWIIIFVALLATPPLLLFILLATGHPPPLYMTVGAFALWVTLALLRGVLIERLLESRYFAQDERVTLAALATSRIQHIFCATDLVTGRPVYASTKGGGTIFRRLGDLPDWRDPRTLAPDGSDNPTTRLQKLGVSYDAASVSLAGIVRASAGFPGIPPRLLRWQTLGNEHSRPPLLAEGERAPKSFFFKTGHGGPQLDPSSELGLALSGGGHRASLFALGVLMAMRDLGRLPTQVSSVSGGSITNAYLAREYFSRVNLKSAIPPFQSTPVATNNGPALAFLSDGGIWNNVATQCFEDGFAWGTNGPWIVLVADASADLEFDRAPRTYQVPGLAEIRALVRQATIQNANTVSPRRGVYHDAIRREVEEPQSARFEVERLYPMISSRECPDDIVARYLSSFAPKEFANDHLLTPEALMNRQERRGRMRSRAEGLKLEPQYEALCRLARINEPPPLANSSIRGVSEPTASVVTAPPDHVASFPTTLGRVDLNIAKALVGRGYANTAVVLYLSMLVDKPLVLPQGWLAPASAQRRE
jgi:hypothetical protein